MENVWQNLMSSSLADRTRIEVSLIIPTYNKRENIGILLQQVYSVLQEAGRSFEVIVVDDDSPDGTWEVVQEMIHAYPHLRVLRRMQERGLARAVISGWQEARGDSCRYGWRPATSS